MTAPSFTLCIAARYLLPTVRALDPAALAAAAQALAMLIARVCSSA